LRRRLGFVVTAMLFVAAVLPTASVVPLVGACNSLPQAACFGHVVSALGSNEACTTCLQRSCCDEVGACQDDQACRDAVRSAHSCVLTRAKSESECVSPLGDPKDPRRRLYDCMRRRCGGLIAAEAPCEISSCNVNPAVVQLGPPACDRCVNNSCCKEVNECYLDRRCKLAVECIVRDCAATLGQEMSELGALGPEAVSRSRQAICSSGTDRPRDDGADGSGGGCIQKCLEDFAPATGGTSDDANARCLAYSVFACGAGSGCGQKCTETPIRDAAAD
jgi:hypothetical protein